MKVVEVFFKTERKFTNKDAEKLRGFMGNYFRNILEFHNHLDEITFNYHSSIIQYRTVNEELSILGINKGADLLLENCQEITIVDISGEKIEVTPEIKISFPKIEIKDEPIYKYKFDSLWFALNSENYKKYLKGELSLEKQLINNILEFLKSAEIWIEKKIIVKGEFNQKSIYQKDTKIIGFYGEFYTNINLPNNISLGKRKSIGLGRIKKLGLEK